MGDTGGHSSWGWVMGALASVGALAGLILRPLVSLGNRIVALEERVGSVEDDIKGVAERQQTDHDQVGRLTGQVRLIDHKTATAVDAASQKLDELAAAVREMTRSFDRMQAEHDAKKELDQR